jgi:PPOX class probable F420-dependent enzyme
MVKAALPGTGESGMPGTGLTEAGVASTQAGRVGPDLAALAKSWSAQLTTFRRSGVGVATPVNLAIVGEKGYFRSYHSAGKVKRLRNNGKVTLAPCTPRGKVTGAAIEAHARLLSGEEVQVARKALAKRFPVFQRVLIPTLHKLARYRTVHYEVTFS